MDLLELGVDGEGCMVDIMEPFLHTYNTIV
jgi:hypothetical protein